MIQEKVIALLKREARELKVETRELCGMILQHNPERAISSGAKVDEESIAKRPCFLCRENRPKEQGSVDWNDKFEILVNPYPILEGHLTIALKKHEPQKLYPYLQDMADLAKALPKFIIFFNGANCGASAPDHMHFQAVYAGQTPMEKGEKAPSLRRLRKIDDVSKIKEYIDVFGLKYDEMINLFCKYNEDTDTYTYYLFERRKHRPCVYDMGLMVSPGAIDMAGVLVMPQKKMFDTVPASIVSRIFDEV